jgi:hypothetical protein
MKPQSKPRRAFRDHAVKRRPGDLFTIPGFCAANAISPSKYHDLKRRGLGPEELDIDGMIRITEEANQAWRAARQAESGKAKQLADAGK